MARKSVIATLGVSLALGGASCGTSSAGPTGPIGAAPPKVSVVSVTPRSGPLGTTFTLVASGIKAGDAVAFEITFPGEGKAYPGAALTVPADGIATTTYRATSANQPGEYSVRLTGAPGTLAEGRFTVTNGPPLTSAIDTTSSSGPSTTKSVRTTTTLKGGSTTTVLPAGATSTSIKASTTTTPKATSTSTTLAAGGTTSTTR